MNYSAIRLPSRSCVLRIKAWERCQVKKEERMAGLKDNAQTDASNINSAARRAGEFTQNNVLTKKLKKEIKAKVKKTAVKIFSKNKPLAIAGIVFFLIMVLVCVIFGGYKNSSDKYPITEDMYKELDQYCNDKYQENFQDMISEDVVKNITQNNSWDYEETLKSTKEIVNYKKKGRVNTLLFIALYKLCYKGEKTGVSPDDYLSISDIFEPNSFKEYFMPEQIQRLAEITYEEDQKRTVVPEIYYSPVATHTVYDKNGNSFTVYEVEQKKYENTEEKITIDDYEKISGDYYEDKEAKNKLTKNYYVKSGSRSIKATEKIVKYGKASLKYATDKELLRAEGFEPDNAFKENGDDKDIQADVYNMSNLEQLHYYVESLAMTLNIEKYSYVPFEVVEGNSGNPGGTGGYYPGGDYSTFVSYCQWQGEWANQKQQPNGKYTVAEAGCNIAAYADIVASWVDESVTPMTLIDNSDPNSYYGKLKDSNTAAFTDQIVPDFGLDYECISDISSESGRDRLFEVLSEGKSVLIYLSSPTADGVTKRPVYPTCAKDGTHSKGQYITKKQHWVVLVAIEEQSSDDTMIAFANPNGGGFDYIWYSNLAAAAEDGVGHVAWKEEKLGNGKPVPGKDETVNPAPSDDTPHLTKSSGMFQSEWGWESYYNLDMSGVVEIMRGTKWNHKYNYSREDYPVWYRSDGVKMFGNYIMCAANMTCAATDEGGNGKWPRGSLKMSSLGMCIVVDYGDFSTAHGDDQIDIAVTWTTQ